MSKLSTLFTITLLLFFMLAYAGRPAPAALSVLQETQVGGVVFVPDVTQDVREDNVEVDESCGGVGEEECLVRRTLAAHVDYIYTQRHNP